MRISTRLFRCLFLFLGIPGICIAFPEADGQGPDKDSGSVPFARATCGDRIIGKYVEPGTVLAYGPDTVLAQLPRTRIEFVRSQNPKASLRPILVFFPGGVGFSPLTMEPMMRLRRSFDIAHVSTPGMGSDVRIPVFGPTHEPKYEFVIHSAKQELLRFSDEMGGRPLIPVGFSSGADYAAEITARFGEIELPNIIGLVVMSGSVTRRSLLALSRTRNAAKKEDLTYLTLRNWLLNWTVKEIDRYARIRFRGQIVHAEMTPTRRLELRMAAMRDLLIELALSHGDLIWNPGEEENATRELIKCDIHSCSPEAVRLIQNNRALDSKRGNWTVTSIAARHLPVLSIIGDADRLVPPEELIADAKLLNATIEMVPGGSHFVYMTNLEFVVRAIEGFLGVEAPTTKP